MPTLGVENAFCRVKGCYTGVIHPHVGTIPVEFIVTGDRTDSQSRELDCRDNRERRRA